MKNQILPEHKKRLDVETAFRGFSRSRSSAKTLIEEGFVSVNEVIVRKPDFLVSDTDTISVSQKEKFVSRAGEKIDHALTFWKIDVTGLTVLDIGSSTGGFTDCLLQRGAAKVIAVDVGTNQLVPEIRNNNRVEVHEGTDIRKFILPSPVDLIVTDVSFISLSLILSHIFNFLKKDGRAILLVKPQFEVGKKISDDYRGVITSESEHKRVIENVANKATEIRFKVIETIDSPITGEKGNHEFLMLIQK